MPEEEESDHQLMSEIAAGNERAFAKLIDRHKGAVVGTVSKMLGNSTDSEDIAQLVFVRIWKHSRKYRPDCKFTTYLYTIVRNLTYNESRRRSRKKAISIDAMYENDGSEQSIETRYNPDQQVLDAEMRKEIDSAIHSLPEKQRLAMILRRFENMPYDQIASVLGCSVSSVKSLLFRAREHLRATLSHLVKR